MNEKLFTAGLAMGLAMGGQGQELLKRIEAFKKEVEELGVEVKVTKTPPGKPTTLVVGGTGA
ncbi:unnamed protein product [marine sediment metagenome]|uniref:Uncharacterized protein n=1 Tax=marine sediment metagenome TaxID=412755 RepID=X1FR27_9ZZZZ